jgi:hypothetical protein
MSCVASEPFNGPHGARSGGIVKGALAVRQIKDQRLPVLATCKMRHSNVVEV